MKKLLALASVAVFAAPVAQAEMKMPTVYGKLNKSYLHVSQEDVYNRKSTPGLVDVDNSESRLGAKGSYDMGTWKANYALEMGFNSTAANDGTGTSGRIRVRLAKVDFETAYGTVTVGQDYTATALAVLGIDTFNGTVASGVGADYAAYVQNAASGVGFLYRSRKDLVKYSTPSFGGAKYTISVDKNDDRSNTSTDAGGQPTYFEHLLSFDKDLGMGKLGLHAGMVTWAKSATGDNSNLLFGGKYSMNGFTVLLGWSQEENKKTNATTDVEKGRMTAGLKYNHGAHTASLGYYKLENETKVTGGTTTKVEDTQISVGYDHMFNKNVSMNAIFTSLEHKDPAHVAVTNVKNNDATIFSVGTVLKF
ncbi:porin [Halobacteriovorax sp. HLS]|uniref:porin n=1 Tax=Halobacteriovorax sp. HLS TaxID=2234000 RepID=UPI000FD78E6A|nr:porin [Halobacteriovorax sp. HLS]